MTEYPEHEKLMAVKDESQAIGEFLEFGPYTLCELRRAGDNGEPEYVWTGRWADPAFRRKRGAYPPRPGFGHFLNGRAEHNPDHEAWDEAYVPVGKPIAQLLADYFEIDLDKIEAEKRRMLDELREANAR